MEDKALFPVSFCILSSAIVLNVLGLCLLFKDGTRTTNQNLILKYLSSVELVCSCLMLTDVSMIYHGWTGNDRVFQVLTRILYSVYPITSLIMVMMTLDRFIATKYPLRYVFILTKKKARVILSTSTFVCIFGGASTSFLEFDKFLSTFDQFVFPAISTSATLFMCAAYAYIFIKVSKRRNMDHSMQNIRIRRTTENQQFLKMASIITLTYLTCYVVPDFGYMLCAGCFIDGIDVYRILWYLGPVLDPIAYIFMQKRLRERVTKVIFCRKKNQMDSSRVEDGASRIHENRKDVFDTKL